MQKAMSCPQCEQIDRVAKITAIVGSGTSRSQYSGTTTIEISSSLSDYMRDYDYSLSGTAYHSLSGIEQTDLAAKLSPPAKPKNLAESHIGVGILLIVFAGLALFAVLEGIRLIIPIGLVGILGFVVFSTSVQDESYSVKERVVGGVVGFLLIVAATLLVFWLTEGEIIYRVGGSLLAGGIGIFCLREGLRIQRKFKEDMIQWREEMAFWGKVYYCARCDMAFIPGEDLTQAMQF